MKPRAVAVLLENGLVAMIERRRQGHLFYVFPGGHVERGETPAEAAIREAKEELGLDVRVVRLLAEFDLCWPAAPIFPGRVLRR